MAKIYYDLIVVGLWKIEDVPSLWRADVEAMLQADQQKATEPTK